MQVKKTIQLLQSDLEKAAEALGAVEEVEDVQQWSTDHLMPALESMGMALAELADEAESNFSETAEVLGELLDEDDEDEGYLIPAEVTGGTIELLNLARGIIQAFVDKATPDTLDAQIAAFETGSVKLIEKMTELTEDPDDEDDDPEDPDEDPEDDNDEE